MAINNPEFSPNNATMIYTMQGAIPLEYGTAIIKEVMANSLVMQLGQFEEMSSSAKTFDVFLDGLGAYWVGEGQRIETTAPTWTQVGLLAKKLGVILPVSREYLYYKQADFFEMMKPFLAEALYKKFDAAAILGVDSPFSQSIDGATIGERSDSPRAVVEGGITVENFDKMIGVLNDEGYEPNAIVSKIANTTTLRGLVRDANGMKTQLYQHSPKQLEGIPVFDINKDITDFKKGTLYSGDFNMVRYGIPYTMTYKLSEDATLTTIVDEEGHPLNLFEREMVALRVTMDVAFMILKDEAFAKIEANPTV